MSDKFLEFLDNKIEEFERGRYLSFNWETLENRLLKGLYDIRNIYSAYIEWLNEEVEQ